MFFLNFLHGMHISFKKMLLSIYRYACGYLSCVSCEIRKELYWFIHIKGKKKRKKDRLSALRTYQFDIKICGTLLPKTQQPQHNNAEGNNIYSSFFSYLAVMREKSREKVEGCYEKYLWLCYEMNKMVFFSCLIPLFFRFVLYIYLSM